MPLQIKNLTSEDEGRWDAFVERCPSATFFHKAGWKRVLERAYGHPTFYLFAERDGEIQGVLPLAQIKSFFFGNTLVSTPFCVYGGIVAEGDEASDLLRKEACNIAEGLGVDALELRNTTPSGAGWPTKSLYATFRKTIDPDPDVNMKAIPRKQRAMVRKGIKAGLVGEEDSGWQRFFRIYSESVRNLGTPVFPARYFSILREVFKDDCAVLMINHEERDVAGVMSFHFRDEILPYYGGSTAKARPLKANDFMYWELMRRSAEAGIRVFDYGRSKEGTGSYSFKKNWGFTPENLAYEYYLMKSDRVPDVNPLNPKYQLFIKAWKKLPLTIANALGPHISRSLG